MGTDEHVPFKSPKLIPVLIGVFLFLFVGGLLLVTFLDVPARELGPNSENYSSLGHHAFVEILKQSGFKVYRSHHFFYLQEHQKTVLFLEPDPLKWEKYTHQAFSRSVRRILQAENDIILACPKWEVTSRHPSQKEWIAGYRMISTESVNRLLTDLELPLRIFHQMPSHTQAIEASSRKTYDLKAESLQVFSISSNARVNPKVLAETSSGNPVVCLLYGFAGTGGKLIVVSDPDLFNTMGIGEGENGPLLLSILRKEVPTRRLWVDEVCHGLGYPPSILRALLTYPALCITLQSVLIGLFLAWLAGIRFRPPLPLPQRKRSLEEQVKAFTLITCASTNHGYFLQKYLKSVIQELSDHFPSINSLPFSKKIAYLDELAKARGVKYSLKLLYDKSLIAKKVSSVMTVARGIHLWREAMGSKKRIS